jgi:hypothetical protein
MRPETQSSWRAAAARMAANCDRNFVTEIQGRDGGDCQPDEDRATWANRAQQGPAVAAGLEVDRGA